MTLTHGVCRQYTILDAWYQAQDEDRVDAFCRCVALAVIQQAVQDIGWQDCKLHARAYMWLMGGDYTDLARLLRMDEAELDRVIEARLERRELAVYTKAKRTTDNRDTDDINFQTRKG